MAAFAPPLMLLAANFGPAEYFSLMVLGLIGAVVLASGSLLKAIAMVVLGLLLGLVGTDVNSGIARFSFDIPELIDGILAAFWVSCPAAALCWAPLRLMPSRRKSD